MKQVCKKYFVVLICLLLLGNFTHGIVLCLGSDGHVSIELESTGCCDEPLETPSAGENIEAMDSCGHCIDIPLFGNCLTKQNTSFMRKKVSLNVLPQTAVSVSTNSSAIISKELIAKQGDHYGYTLDSICTTVLII